MVYRFCLPDLLSQPSTPPTEADLDVIPHATCVSTPPPSEISPDRPSAATSQHETNDLEHFRGRLLRLRKEVPNALSYTAQSASTQQNFVPLFHPTHLVSHELVTMPANLANCLNQRLITAEQTGERPAERCGVYLSTEEPYGMLLDDMTASGAGSTALALEFKPKWLVQSPNAPMDAIRCRNCALRAARSHGTSSRNSSTDTPEKLFMCPLDLVTKTAGRTIPALLDGRTITAPLRDRLRDFLETGSVLVRLRELQKELDPYGVLSLGHNDQYQDVLKAMSLRDCTLYIRIPTDIAEPIEGRLGDLDLKVGNEKMRYWTSLEQSLNEGGWYQGHAWQASTSTGCRLERPK